MKSKIARLPKNVRHQLSLRIEDNHPGVEIVQWLNSLPDVQKIIADQFNGSAISEQNLSDWKSSGHLDWLRHEAALESARQFIETSDDLDLAAQQSKSNLLDRFAAILAVEMMRAGLALLQKETDLEKKWKLACQLNRELSRLRRDNDRAQRTALDQANPNQAVSPRKRPESPHANNAADRLDLVTQTLEDLMEDGAAHFRLPGSILSAETASLLRRTKFPDLPINGTSKPQQIQPGKAW